MKVLVLENALNVTGGFTSILLVSNAFQSEVETVFVMPTGSACSLILREEGFKVYELPYVELSRRVKDFVRYIPRLLQNAYAVAKIVAREKIEVVHTNDLYNLCAYTSRLFGMQLPIVTHIRMMPTSFPKIIYLFWTWLHLKLASRIICVSEAVARPFIHSSKAKVIFGRVSLHEKYLNRESIAKPITETVSLLYVGNYMKGKGQDYAIEAFKEAYMQNPALRMTFIGDDMGLKKNKRYKLQLIEKVREYRLQQVISFEAKSNDVEKELKSYHIALNFSESESFSLTCLEALYYGTPLIATDCGGPAELFENGKSGLLIPVGDVAKMKEAIMKVADDIALRKRFSKEGRQYVINKFIQNDTPGELKRIYFQLAKTKELYKV